MNTIKDIFGNEIEVTSITGALLENAQMLAICNNMTEDDHIQWIDEYKIKKSVDNWGKSFGYSARTNSGKKAHIKEFHEHNGKQLTELLKQINNPA